ncbi:MAG TPA: MotA/TolQ/ExbB proton channel family protein [Bryobacteraceae bacterium]|nr:MotA/TolQ/ExbB proton channel family protein [Bryobacteraceae bacterium]
MSTSQAFLTELPTPGQASTGNSSRRVDFWMLAGIAIAIAATIAGVASTGVSPTYFFQPTGALIVIGGTLGVTFITTPRVALLHSLRRVGDLFLPARLNRQDLIEEIVSYVRLVRVRGLMAIEPMLDQTSNRYLAESLLLAMDVNQRGELETALANKLRLSERQGEADAKVLEVAGGFAPTIGVLGTVVGLIDVLRQFSTVSSVAAGLGTAFVSTIYGLALANLVLLPAAHRIRARVAEAFEIQELIMEGTLCLFDRIHPSLVRQRLSCFVRDAESELPAGTQTQNAAAR